LRPWRSKKPGLKIEFKKDQKGIYSCQRNFQKKLDETPELNFCLLIAHPGRTKEDIFSIFPTPNNPKTETSRDLKKMYGCKFLQRQGIKTI